MTPWYAAYERDAIPLLPVMARMTAEGWLVDRDVFEERRAKLKSEVKALGEAVNAAFVGGVAPKSRSARTTVSLPQLKKVLLAEGVRLPTTRKGNPRLDREARSHLFAKTTDGRIKLLERYLETQDTLSDFYKAGIIAADGRCHARWSGYEASWRWRCTGPNLTQWPEEDRDVFIADPGCELYEADTAFGEYCWFAGETGDPWLLSVVREYAASRSADVHPHVQNCALLFGVGLSEATQWKTEKSPKYTFAKNYLFRLMNAFEGDRAYRLNGGGGVDSLRASAAKAGLKFNRAEIVAFDDVWFGRARAASAWRVAHVARARLSRRVVCREWGYTRLLHAPWPASQKGGPANEALDHVWQAGIAGLINQAIRRVLEVTRTVPRANMHDGIVYCWPAERVEEYAAVLGKAMSIPLATLGGLVIPYSARRGERWGRGMSEAKGGG